MTLKIYTRDAGNQGEVQIYKQLNLGRSWHPGHAHVRKALDIFTIPSSGGGHPCLFRIRCGRASGTFCVAIPTIDLPKISSNLVLCRSFLHLTIYTLNASLSTRVRRIHKALLKCVALIWILIDIKSDNILQEIEDKSILESFTQAELKNPSPRKIVNGLPVYVSRRFDLPKVFGRAVLSDFGSAVRGDERRNHDAQPSVI